MITETRAALGTLVYELRLLAGAMITPIWRTVRALRAQLRLLVGAMITAARLGNRRLLS